MNINERTALNWVMVECLAREVWFELPTEWHEGAMLEQLMHWYACRDRRFRMAGFWWSQPDGYLVYSPQGGPSDLQADVKTGYWRHERQDWFVGEAAIAAFLGLEVKSTGIRMQPTAPALSFIYKRFASAPEAVDWIHRQVAKRHGMRTAEYEEVATNEWPFIANGVLRADLFLEIRSIKHQLAGEVACSITVRTQDYEHIKPLQA